MRHGRLREPVSLGLPVLIRAGCASGLLALAILVPVGPGFVPKGGGWFRPAVVGGAFTAHPLLTAVPWAACFILGLSAGRNPRCVEQLDVLALAGFFPVAMLFSDDIPVPGLWLAAVCLGWLCVRLLGAYHRWWPMPGLRPAVSSRLLGAAIVVLLVARAGVMIAGNISDVGMASSAGAWRLLHGAHLYGAVSWRGAGGFQLYRPDSYGPFAYYAYLPFALVLPPAPAVIATLLPAVCFDALTIAGLYRIGRRLGGQPLARAFIFGYLLYPFPALSLAAETNDGLIAALCVWTVVIATEPAPSPSADVSGARLPDSYALVPYRLWRPVTRGLLVAAATLTKFLPGLLALQLLGPRPGRWRYLAALAGSLAAMLAWPLLSSGPASFFGSTFGYQLSQRGGDGAQFSIWTYLPHLAIVLRAVLAVALVLAALSPLARGRVRRVQSQTARERPEAGAGPREQAALAAALLFGAQLLLGYWFYSYLTWCYPLLVIAVVRLPPDAGGSAPDPASGSGWGRIRHLGTVISIKIKREINALNYDV